MAVLYVGGASGFIHLHTADRSFLFMRLRDRIVIYEKRDERAHLAGEIYFVTHPLLPPNTWPYGEVEFLMMLEEVL